MNGLLVISGFAVSGAVFAELLGVPTAWLRLRKTQVWNERPRSVRRIDLLAAFVSRLTFLAALLGAITGVTTWIGAVLS